MVFSPVFQSIVFAQLFKKKSIVNFAWFSSSRPDVTVNSHLASEHTTPISVEIWPFINKTIFCHYGDFFIIWSYLFNIFFYASINVKFNYVNNWVFLKIVWAVLGELLSLSKGRAIVVADPIENACAFLLLSRFSIR